MIVARIFFYLIMRFVDCHFCNLLSNLWTQHRVDGRGRGEICRQQRASQSADGRRTGGRETWETWRESCLVLRDGGDLGFFEAGVLRHGADGHLRVETYDKL